MNKKQLLEKLEQYKLDLFEEEKAKNSIYNYCSHAKLFVMTLAHDNNITKNDVISFKQYLIEVLEFKANTTNAYIISVNKFLHYCNLDEFKVKHLKVQQETVIEEIMSKNDYKRLLKYSDTETRLIMKILANTGIRVVELKYFTYENIKKSTYLNISNKGKTRKIILRQDLRREILKYCKERNIESGYIFYSKKDRNKMIHRSTIFRRFKRIAGKAKLKLSLIYPHAFRHLFASVYLESGGNPLNLADILGHSSTKTTIIYTKKTQNQLRDTLEEMKF